VDTSDSEPTSRVRPANVRMEVATATRIGRRQVNADCVIVDEPAALFGVADGMGDAPSSAVAAQAVLAAVGEPFPPTWASLPHSERAPREARERLRMGLALAHAKLFRPWLPRRERLGATFTGMVVCGEALVVGHVGDSRVGRVPRDLPRATRAAIPQASRLTARSAVSPSRPGPAPHAARPLQDCGRTTSCPECSQTW
jgi:serine/threonine protein phosphatase PrpC